MRAKEFISELFEPQFKNTKKTVSHDFHALRNKSMSGDAKAGSFGYVVDTPNDPGTVTKTAFDDELDSDESAYEQNNTVVDAYYLWVKACAKYQHMTKNPYLPRVFSVDDREDAQGTRSPRYQIEKLYHPTHASINSEMLKVIAERTGILDHAIEHLSRESARYVRVEYDVKSGPEYDEFFEKRFKRMIWENIVTKINLTNVFEDVMLSLAVDTVDALVRNWQAWCEEKDDDYDQKRIWRDTHSGNFMIRITSVGPQLVFTDPIAGMAPYHEIIEFIEQE
jgi:hypothetical protein